MVITSIPRSHVSVSLSLSCLVFFPSIKQTTEKKIISLSLSLSLSLSNIYYILREEKKKTKAFVLHYKTRSLLLLLHLLFLIFDHLLRAREKEREGDILKRNSGIAISQKPTPPRPRFFSFSGRDVNDEKLKKKKIKKKENAPTSEIAVCPVGIV